MLTTNSPLVVQYAVSVFSFLITIALYQVAVREERSRNKKKVCAKMLEVLKPVVAHIISYELVRKKNACEILFHGIEKQYLYDCVQALRNATPCTEQATRAKLIELEAMIQGYLWLSTKTITKSIKLRLGLLFKKMHTHSYDIELAEQRACLALMYSGKTRKKWYRHCRKYFEDLAYIKAFFDEVVALLNKELAQ
jgi:hypothetical protein